MEITSKSPEFVVWLASCQKLIDKHMAENFPNNTPYVLSAEDGGKVIKVISTGVQRMVYCFVAKCDNNTKALGNVKCGDILKAESWKKPSKHARDNLFSPTKGMDCMTPYGTEYLR